MKKKKFVVIVCVLAVAILISGVWIIKMNNDKQNTSNLLLTNQINQESAGVQNTTEALHANSQQEALEMDTTSFVDPHGYAVSSSNATAVQVGMSILEAGGNAADAAVAISFVLSVVEPYSNGLGGSGSLVLYDTATGYCYSYDYRAQAGAEGRFNDQTGAPGLVAGMERLNQDYGTMGLSQLLQPAIYYAENGFEVDAALATRIQANSAALSQQQEFFSSSGTPLKAGERLVQKELAQTLTAIAEKGAEVFYRGYIADNIVSACGLTQDELAEYKVYVREALSCDYEGYQVYSAEAPMCGVTLLQMLVLSEKLDLVNPKDDLDTYIEQLRLITGTAFADRYSSVSDPSVKDIHMAEHLSEEYIDRLLGVDSNDGDDREFPDTTSFTVVDANGMAVSCTNTLSSFWGNDICVNGFFLNNTNSNFSNNGINAYESGKRSRTFSAPTIVTGANGFVLAVGTPGGNNIPSLLFQVLTSILKFDMDYQDAVNAGRLLYRSDVLYAEYGGQSVSLVDINSIQGQIVKKRSGYWWGCVSLTGYSSDEGAFAAYDYRRGATMAGTFNP